MSNRNDYRLGSIWLVQFDPSVGTEIQKTRPGVIVSGDVFNQQRSKVTVLPLTSVKLEAAERQKLTAVLVEVSPNAGNGLTVTSAIVCVDPATFDKRRLMRCLGQLDRELVEQAQAILRRYLCLG
jgi:mRNA interferase MazF